MTLITSSDAKDSLEEDQLSGVSSQLGVDYEKKKLFGFPRPVFVIIMGAFISFLCIASLCLYNLILSKRESRYAGFIKVGTRTPASLFDDDDDEADLWNPGTVSKSYKAEFYNKRLIQEEEDSSSEDELYNVRVYSDDRNQVT